MKFGYAQLTNTKLFAWMRIFSEPVKKVWMMDDATAPIKKIQMNAKELRYAVEELRKQHGM